MWSNGHATNKQTNIKRTNKHKNEQTNKIKIESISSGNNGQTKLTHFICNPISFFQLNQKMLFKRMKI